MKNPFTPNVATDWVLFLQAITIGGCLAFVILSVVHLGHERSYEVSWTPLALLALIVVFAVYKCSECVFPEGDPK